MDDVPAEQTVNGAVSIVRIRHHDQAGLPGYGAHDEAGKSRITAAMGDKVTLLRVLYLPPERLRHRSVDLHLRAEHFLKAGLVESKRIAPFRVDDFDEEPGVVRRRRAQPACRSISCHSRSCWFPVNVSGFSLLIMPSCHVLFHCVIPEVTARSHSQ